MAQKPTTAQIKQISLALLDAFNHSSLIRLVRIEFDEQLEWFTPVHGKRDLTTVVDHLVQYFAAKDNGLNHLLNGSLVQNPTNKALLELRSSWSTIEFEAISLPRHHPSINSNRRYLNVIIATSLSILFFVVATWWSQRPPSQMPKGDFNIAVASFNLTDNSDASLDTNALRELSSTIAGFLESDKLKPIIGKEVTIWEQSHGVKPIISGSEAQIAQQLNADVLVYGDIREGKANQWMVHPKFFLTDKAVFLATELYGEHALGTPIPHYLDAASDKELTKIIEVRLEALTQLLIGLSFYERGKQADYSTAAKIFNDIADGEWGRSELDSGQEILLLFQGNAHLKWAAYTENDHDERFELLDKSQKYFSTAIAENEFHGRAYNGLGSSFFQMARPQLDDIENECGWDWNLMKNATNAFQQAFDAPPAGKPSSGKVDLRSNLGLGKVQYWVGYCGEVFPPFGNEWMLARKYYDVALQEYESAPKHLFALEASLIYSDLGFMSLMEANQLLMEGENNSNKIEPLLETSIDAYQQSIELIDLADSDESHRHALSVAPYYLTALCLHNDKDGAYAALSRVISLFEKPTEIQNHILEITPIWGDCTS